MRNSADYGLQSYQSGRECRRESILLVIRSFTWLGRIELYIRLRARLQERIVELAGSSIHTGVQGPRRDVLLDPFKLVENPYRNYSRCIACNNKEHRRRLGRNVYQDTIGLECNFISFIYLISVQLCSTMVSYQAS
jgi:hypothetical protein